MIKFEIKGNIKFPDLQFDRELRLIADRIVIPEIQRRIHQGEDITGSQYEPLSDSTIKQKRRKHIAVSHPESPLIDTGKLFSSFYSREQGKNTVVVAIKTVRSEIGTILQVEGVRTKRGRRRFHFFDKNEVMQKSVLLFMKKRINELTSKYAKR